MHIKFAKTTTVATRASTILFVLRERTTTWGQTDPHLYNSSGLFNSATFVSGMLQTEGFISNVVQVVDGNAIDREVTKHDPAIVVLEAIWVTPEKVRELVSLPRHKNRKWIIRNHSELPFLSMEGNALKWLIEYATIKNTFVSCNSPVANRELQFLLELHHGNKASIAKYLPNYYPADHAREHKATAFLDVGCFGAIRPLKNHLIQAVAAIMFAKRINRPLRLHINASRIEGRGDTILKSLRSIFCGLPQYQLVEHGWLSRDKFLDLCDTMDIGLQVSFSETFNIVTADLVSKGVPCVTSDEVPWMPKKYHALATSAEDICEKMVAAGKDGAYSQLKALRKYANTSKIIWIDEIVKLTK